ncbi:MAG TPA: bifunctional ornithine acetyltransferase/N-acetylglutamate synthase [Methanotrichaceae archaeon]|nr:bifunctional ornithine acetyltransferase/N-acetylglutamate synthase [Methanotrichaceae archaeon]HQF16823.1 bifunctional ornithine acetyltransferase/N-acetylglutamate synthase [Methanotrichaceae archaeon]HQI90149.1 bifunctional ornithine acetyltransferase/N-acetylglutamate synthase [Methanotrichaceae archaeon]HQJ29129.1 bifunctional ornithine acetyltransferase/N-acetylglutamate synthase [Methanotrichaceae archaeon]
MKVREVMNPEPVACQAAAPVSEASRILREKGISGMPVLDGDRLVGVVSESDLLRLLKVPDEEGGLWLPSPFEILEVPVRDLIRWERMKSSLEEISGKKVSDVMNRHVWSASPDYSLEEAATLMTRHRVNRLPVVEDGRLVGIVTRGDIISALGAREGIKEIEGGICAVQGVRASGIKQGKNGVALIACSGTAAGVFTTNLVRAAPVLFTQDNVANQGRLEGIIANSGCANAYTGPQGIADAREMAAILGTILGCKPELVGVASTGVIGRYMDLGLVEGLAKEAAARLRSDPSASPEAATAIMTTDTRVKEAAVKFRGFCVAGICKGAGMIEPHMATMLGFLFTDAAVSRENLDEALREAVDGSFNMLTVDGDTSTNDMVIIISTGKVPCQRGDFQEALNHVCTALARKMARDGEGASKAMEVIVEGAKSIGDARLAAKAVARSSLVKTALYGQDPNWGRIVCAAGYSGAKFDPDKVTLIFQAEGRSVTLVDEGKIQEGVLDQAKALMGSEEIIIRLRLGDGEASARAFGCDLTHEYVDINAKYTT